MFSTYPQVIQEDPTQTDVERLVVGSTVSNAITHLARKQSLASVYVPITLHFSLLSSIRGMVVPLKEKKNKTLDPLSALLAAEKQTLRYCGDREDNCECCLCRDYCTRFVTDGIQICPIVV